MSDAPTPPEGAPARARDAFQALARATASQMADLETLLAMLTDWNGRMNLVGASTLPFFWNRHAWDSAQLLALEPDALTWADLGAGAGFPGLVLSILLKNKQNIHIDLVESTAKRCRFLTEVSSALHLQTTVHNRRAEDCPLTVDVVTARACAPLTKLLGFAKPCLDRGARGLFLKGEEAAAEIEEAHKTWRFSADILPSQSDPRGRILRIERLARVR